MIFLGIDESNCCVVTTHASGVNYADVIIRWGLYKSAKETIGWPITPGFEFSETVSKVGENVNDFKVGDKVCDISLFGAYSQKIIVPSNQLYKVPDNVNMSEAAGFLCTALTAYYAVHELCKLRKGDSFLIHSAAGGVGSMLVQLTKKLECNVVGVVGRTHKVDIAKQLGKISFTLYGWRFVFIKIFYNISRRPPFLLLKKSNLFNFVHFYLI